MATATDTAAWVGAVSGLAALVWDFYKWKFAGPRLRGTAKPGMIGIGRGVDPSAKYLLISVKNTGRTKTTISTLSFATYRSRWARHRLDRTAAGVVPQPITADALPHVVDVGEEWSGTVLQNDYLNGMLATGNMWCELYHSWSKRPLLFKVLQRG